MKYARLDKEELEKLSEDFINFLVVNGITAEDWEKIKITETDNANKIIDQFSDVVWEGALRKTKYLDKIENDVSYFFKCDEHIIHLCRISKHNGKSIVQTASKPFKKNREEELFEMISNGCEISDGTNNSSVNT